MFRPCTPVPIQTFAELLLKSPYVTTNPAEADYFYVWVRNLDSHAHLRLLLHMGQ